jgi:hypothetical protein
MHQQLLRGFDEPHGVRLAGVLLEGGLVNPLGMNREFGRFP